MIIETIHAIGRFIIFTFTCMGQVVVFMYDIGKAIVDFVCWFFQIF